MKIMHITTALGNGGAESAMYRLIKGSPSNDHVVVCLIGTGMYQQLLEEAGIQVYLLDMKASLLPIRSLYRLVKILKLHKPDVVQTWMYHANLIGAIAAKSTGVPKIYWGIRMSNPRLGRVGKATQFVNWICAKLGNALPTKIVSCAHKATEEHIKIGYPESKFVTIPNGYNLNEIRFSSTDRNEIRKKWTSNANAMLIGVVARWHPQKDHKTLMEALSHPAIEQNDSWELILIGPNMDEKNAQLAKLINRYNLSNRCVLSGPASTIAPTMSGLDLLVLSSSDEGFPNVLAEGMACGTPCVSTDAGDAKHIIGDTGWVSPIKDATALAINIEKAMNAFKHKTEWNTRKEKCRNRIERCFSIEKMSENYNRLWADASEGQH